MLNLDELREQREELVRELAEQRSAGHADIGDLERDLAKLDQEIAKADRRVQEIRTLAADPEHRSEPADIPKEGPRMKKDRTPGHEARDSAQRTIDKAYERGDLPEKDGFRLNSLIEQDQLGLDSEYLAAVGSEVYSSAFAKQLGARGAGASLDPDEAAAMNRAGRAMQMRALASGEGEAGGFAIPISLDPTLILDNDGAVNPIRELATVSTITGSLWKGVKSGPPGVPVGRKAPDLT